MREYIIADNQDITKAGMMFLLSKQKDVSQLLAVDNKTELIRELRLHPQAVVILDYTLLTRKRRYSPLSNAHHAKNVSSATT